MSHYLTRCKTCNYIIVAFDEEILADKMEEHDGFCENPDFMNEKRISHDEYLRWKERIQDGRIYKMKHLIS